MVLIRKRYYTWLIKAYLKKWKNTIFTSLLLGAALFFLILLTFRLYIQPLLEGKKEKIGIVGIYTTENLPEKITSQISYGLTAVDQDGTVKPDAAKSWEIKDDGKKFIFHFKEKQKFHNGKELTTENLLLNFKDAKKNIIDKYTVEFELKKAYSPFLSTVSKPIFIDGYSGLGDYKLAHIDLSSEFVKSITLQNKNIPGIKKIYYFYPTFDALKVAFVLGEIDKMEGVNDLNFKNTNYSSWKNIKISKKIDYKRLVTLFYNSNDKILSNEKIRLGLHFAVPESFKEGEKACTPYPPFFIYYQKQDNYCLSNYEIAKTFLSSEDISINEINLEISTVKEYKNVAEEIQKSWKKIGIKSKIKIVDSRPSDFQILLYPFNVSQDPDQYTLWHSTQSNNISHYNNKRIDKLIEDGRSTTNINERITIYRNFQKYILNDSPASFLYFPYEYIVERDFK